MQSIIQRMRTTIQVRLWISLYKKMMATIIYWWRIHTKSIPSRELLWLVRRTWWTFATTLRTRENREYTVRISTHNVDHLTSTGLTLCRWAESESLAIKSFRSHRLHLDTNSGEEHLREIGTEGTHNGDHQETHNVNPTSSSVYE